MPHIKPTSLQRKAIINLVDSGGNVSEAMVKAGYSPNTAKTPQKLTESEGYKNAAKPFIQKLQAEIDAALELAGEKRDDANYSDLVTGVDKLEKLKQLLGGGVTERIGISLDQVKAMSEEEKKKYISQKLLYE